MTLFMSLDGTYLTMSTAIIYFIQNRECKQKKAVGGEMIVHRRLQ